MINPAMAFEIFSHGAYLGGVRYFHREDSPAILCLHGMIENGRIFYSASGKGLAPWMQKNGYDVFVPDFRGRGLSRPKISEGLRFGQTDMITKDIPDLLDFVFNQKKQKSFYVFTHSWSGVLLMASLLRNPEQKKMIRGVVFFGTKRSIQVWNWSRFLEVEIFWNRLLLATSFVLGYLPAKKWRIGSDDETYLTQKHSIQWIQSATDWKDPVDGTNYSKLCKEIELPPILSLAGIADAYLGNPLDCRSFMQELGKTDPEDFRILGRNTGCKQDYDHISLLTAQDAEADHFPIILQWMKQH